MNDNNDELVPIINKNHSKELSAVRILEKQYFFNL